MSAQGNRRRVALAEERRYDEVLDRDTGWPVSLADFLGNASYGAIIDEKRVALENDLIEGRERFVCPDCDQAMVLRSVPTHDKTEDRFYFRHRLDNGECSGRKDLSPAAICARKFAHAKEGAQHKVLKRLIEDSLAADPRFSNTQTETRWKDVDGVRWRQPDVQSVWQEQRVAFEVQLSTTFLHVIVERMSFYRRNAGVLLWLFRDLDPSEFKLAEDDIFYSNNRNAFRVGLDTLERSRQEGRFVLHCVWHEPHLDARGVLEDRQSEALVGFDELTFDISPSGVPRAFYFDYAGELTAAHEKRERDRQQAIAAQDQALREDLENAVLSFSKLNDGNAEWQALRRRFKVRGFELPEKLYSDAGPFYLLQAAYSAKHGRPVACGIKNLMGLANSLFNLHKDTLWVFAVMLDHFGHGETMMDQGNKQLWLEKRNQCREGWFHGDPAFESNRRYDPLLAFLFPEAAEKLKRSAGQTERFRRQRLASKQGGGQ